MQWKAITASAPRFDATVLVVLPQPAEWRRVCLTSPWKPSSSLVVARMRGSSKQTKRCSP
jgi:hypothetical protein